jgi:predicted O-methyltransferase YrrM
MSRFRALQNYLRYYISASTKHDIHSPFVFELLTNVISDRRPNPAYSEIEDLRKMLLKSRREIDVLDLGAGSAQLTGNRRLIGNIASVSAKSPKYGQLLYRLCARIQPANILELGTSLGISTIYLSAACPTARITTIEGCPEIADQARAHFSRFPALPITLLEGPFRDNLPRFFSENPVVDLVFFDGDHKESATLEYFETCLKHIHSQTVFIFDDIHWTPGMERAWTAVQQHPAVSLTIDLHQMGLVFFRTGAEKQHFTIRF